MTAQGSNDHFTCSRLPLEKYTYRYFCSWNENSGVIIGSCRHKCNVFVSPVSYRSIYRIWVSLRCEKRSLGAIFLSDSQTSSCWLAVGFFSDHLLLMQLAFSVENLTERERMREREGELCELKIDSGRVVVMIASPHNNPSVRLLHFSSPEHGAGIRPLRCL